MSLGIVIGSEGQGMSRLVSDKCDFHIKIPMVGHVNSLNASVAASLMMYEVYRKRHQLEEKSSKKRYLIIDGYNMIGQSSTLSTVAKENLEEAREQLLDTIANYNALIADEIVCVFDAYEQSGIEREYFYHGVKTIFTKEKETADSFIERYVYELYNKTRHTLPL